MRIPYRLWAKFLPVQLILMMGMLGLFVGVTAGFVIVMLRGDLRAGAADTSSNPSAGRLAQKTIAPLFTPEVQFWAPWIAKWSQQYGIDPDMLATVIQIESCGHYLVNSPAGAQGLFQVMPFHFAEGESMLDPETNARRGIGYLLGSLQRADGHIGLALAGYNGGWGVIPLGWGKWPQQTRNYYIWGSQIYMDALAGKKESAALQNWLLAGGINLCLKASQAIAPLQSTLEAGR